jgi:hypothetical protein
MSNEETKPNKKRRVTKSTIIDHSYNDHSSNPFQLPQHINHIIASSHQSLVARPKAETFPMKLHDIVSNHSYQHIIGWMPHGRSWCIKNKDLLVSEVLNEHFNHRNFESFNRQVNIYGFKVRSDDVQSWCQHEHYHSS